VASLLLGMHPPRMRGALLVRWCAHLGIPEGTTRVALSRMIAAGELTVTDGRYELVGVLRARQASQDWSLVPTMRRWHRAWVLHVVRPEARDPADRAALRSAAARARLVELREGVWGRPDNLPPEATPPDAAATLRAQADVWRAMPSRGAEPDAVTLFDVVATAENIRALVGHLDGVTTALRASDGDRLAEAFVAGAAALLQIRHDPLLPPTIVGPGWPGPDLRRTYSRYRRVFAAAVTDWFASSGDSGERPPARSRVDRAQSPTPAKRSRSS
jgi:phenylacetic acid degradation operon negative regulatory protein